MNGYSDYLTLWKHYDSRGFDDKNRMISTASLLISFAGALLGASISSLVASPRQLGMAAGLAMLSAFTALGSGILVKVFKIHAARNFVAADNVTATYSRGAGENARPPTYHITATLSATPLSALENYIITNKGAEFTINNGRASCREKEL